MKTIILLGFLLFTQEKSPFKATVLSILPGGGQFYTKNYLKGTVFFTAQSTLLFLTINEHIKAENAKKENDNTKYSIHSKKRYNLLWWCAGVWTFSMSDAYISAHFYKFKESRIEVGYKF